MLDLIIIHPRVNVQKIQVWLRQGTMRFQIVRMLRDN